VNTRNIETARGTRVRVLFGGDEGAPPLVFLHGIMGLLEDTTFLDQLSSHYRVYAPELPGYGQSSGEELLEDMLDFTLHGWDVVDALQVRQPVLVGHSLGGMIAAEMACLAPLALSQLVLVNPFGLWLDAEPIPDLFALLPYQFGELLFHDSGRAEELLTGASDAADPDALREFFIANARRLGTAGKILFPIPNRRLSKRLYRLTAQTTVVWGKDDRVIPVVYAAEWQRLLAHAHVTCIAEAGHMLPYEQPHAVVDCVRRARPPTI
jgi:pimeloyl-ACP methyl ester carboxylesterase